jgi:hypothetical protein
LIDISYLQYDILLFALFIFGVLNWANIISLYGLSELEFDSLLVANFLTRKPSLVFSSANTGVSIKYSTVSNIPNRDFLE